MQELWLSEKQLSNVKEINKEFLSVVVSSYSDGTVLTGRLCGGCAILVSILTSFLNVLSVIAVVW